MSDCLNQVFHALGVQVAAKPLKLRGEQHGVRLVDLLRLITATSPDATNRRVGFLDLVKRNHATTDPGLIGTRRHRPFP